MDYQRDVVELSLNMPNKYKRVDQVVKEIREIFQVFNITIGSERLTVKEAGSFKYEVLYKLADFVEEFIFVGRVVYYIRNRPYRFIFDTLLAYSDFSPVCVKNPNTRFLVRRHILKLNSLLRYGSFSIDELGVLKFHLLWNFETNVHLAMRTKEDIEKWMKIGLATTMSTLKVNMTKLLYMTEIIEKGKYEYVVGSQPANSIRLLPKFFDDDQEKLKTDIVDGVKLKISNKENTIKIDPLPAYPHLFYQKVKVSTIEYHGRLAVGGYASIHVVKARMRLLEEESKDSSDSKGVDRDKYFLVKVPKPSADVRLPDHEYVTAIAKGEFKEPDARINVERKVISYPANKKFPHIARYYDDKPENNAYERPLLYMENYMPQNLHDFNGTKDLGMGTKLSWLYQLAHVLCYLKENKIVHVDLKPSNIVIAKNFFLKVIDFAESIIKGDPSFKGVKRGTTMPFSSPESLEDNIDSLYFESDVWSFAHIAYELLAGKLMIGFKKSSEKKVRERYRKKTFKVLPIANWLSHLGPQYLMQYIYYIIMLCTTPDPTVRFPQEMLVNFIKDYALFTEKLF